MTHQDPDTSHEPPADTSSAGGVNDPHHGSPYASDGNGAPLTDAGDTPEPGGEEPDGQAAEEDPLAVALRERDDYLDALQRKQADFENFRKRMMRDGATQRIAGHAEVAERMLDVLDDFDRTLANAGTVDPGFLKGVELVHDKLVGVLTDFGLTRIDEQDVTFDPNRHEAVQQQASDDDLDEPRVTQVLRPGYELGGRVLRAAMVVVEQ
jgi:molecular chaperone GrpE